jgi:hypothetical protein
MTLLASIFIEIPASSRYSGKEFFWVGAGRDILVFDPVLRGQKLKMDFWDSPTAPDKLIYQRRLSI